jgi:hypothetical protein
VSSSQALLTTYLRNNSSLLNRKIDEATVGLAASFAKQLHSIFENSAETIVESIAAMKSEVNLSDHYGRALIAVLCQFSIYNNEPFKDLIRPALLGFLDSFSKRITRPYGQMERHLQHLPNTFITIF